MFEKEMFLRIDVPVLLYNNGNSELNFESWVISFQRSI